VRNRLRDARTTAWVALVPLLYFAAEWVVSATWRGHYSYSDDVIGPLGLAFCGPAGNWPCSALYPAMNVALVVTGLAVAFVAASLGVQRIVDRGHAILLLAAGFGLALTGVVTQRVSYSWNLTGIIAFTVLGSVSVLFIALGATTDMSVERRGVAVLAGVTSLVGLFAYLGDHGVFGSGGAQRIAVYGILVAVIAIGTGTFRSAPTRTEPRELVEESP
jgi:hypothetical membrane protein